MSLPLNIDMQQICLHMFNFVVLFGGLYVLLYKPVKDIMDKREQSYQKAKTDAEQMMTDAENMKNTYEEKLQGADKEIAEKNAENMRAQAKKAEEILADADKKAAEIVESAKAQATREHDAILQKTHDDIVKCASDAAKKVVFADTADAYADFLNTAEDARHD